MNRFSENSKRKLATCHSELRKLFEHVILNYDCTIVCGHRREQEQNEAYTGGHSQLQWPNSKHNIEPSLAVDVVPYERNGLDWGKLQSAHFAGYVKGIADQLFRIGTMKHHIRCGIDWNNDNDIDDTQFWDSSHFEIMY